MKNLEQIDNQLKNLNRELVALAETLEFEKVCEFNLENCGAIIPWKSLHQPGLYFLEIKNDLTETDFPEWISKFRNIWEDDRFKAKFVPNIREKRIKQHQILKEWVPIYIGKSKSISARVYEHIYKDLNKTTFALKLMARDNLKNELFRLSYLPIKTDNYDWVVSTVERVLRDKLNPIIGRQ